MEGTRGVGRAIFAAVLLMIGGVLNIFWGIAAIGNSHFFVHNQKYVFSNLKGWGWVTLILGILEILASISLFVAAPFKGISIPSPMRFQRRDWISHLGLHAGPAPGIRPSRRS